MKNITSIEFTIKKNFNIKLIKQSADKSTCDIRKKTENTIARSYSPIKSTMSDRSFPFRFLSRLVRAGLMSRECRTPVRTTCINCDVKLSARSLCSDSTASNGPIPSCRCLPGRYDRPRPPPDFFFDDFGDPHWDISIRSIRAG